MKEKEAIRLLKQVMENNLMILNYKNSYWSYKKQGSKRRGENKIGSMWEEIVMKDRKKSKEERKKKKRTDNE